MYSFVQKKGARLFMRGARQVDDVDDVRETRHHRKIEQRQLEDREREEYSARKSRRHESSESRRRMEIEQEHVEENRPRSKNQMATASHEAREVYRSAQNRSGLKTVHTQRVVRKTTTVSRGEKISDIIHHDDSMSFKEALLRWAQRTTEGYPGVRVTNFTNSWRDGLAFNAILHRNRPDLLDFRSCKTRSARENLEQAFDIADRELGVTRLLDPEDVDTSQIDEKSMITYIASLYELFPEPPARNPLLDDDILKKIEEYRDSATRLLLWIRECTGRFNDRNWPNTINEMKQLKREHDLFRQEEIPPKFHEKQRLSHAYREVSKLASSMSHFLHHELSADNIDILWTRMMTAHQERETAIQEEMLRMEKMQRLAEKLLREIKQCDLKLDDIERDIIEEQRKVQRMDPLETKFNVDQIEADLRREEERIKSMFNDVQTLRDGRYHKASELHSRVQQLHKRWSEMGLLFKTQVLKALADRRAEALQAPLANYEKAIEPLEKLLREKERILNQRVAAAIPRDRDSLENMVIQHKEFEMELSSYEGRVNEVKELYNDIPNAQRTRALVSDYEEIMATWERIWRLSDAYVERLKAVEVALLDLEDCNKKVSSFEEKLSAYETMSIDQVSVRRIVREVNQVIDDLQGEKSMLDALEDGVAKVRRCVEKTRPKTIVHSDVTRLEDDAKQIARRWKSLFNDANDKQKMLRLAEKLLDDIKDCDLKLDDIERSIFEEERRVQRMDPLETKFNIDEIQEDLRREEQRIKSMFNDVQALRDGRYPKASELHNRVQKLHQRWSEMGLLFKTKVLKSLEDRRSEALKAPLANYEKAIEPLANFLIEKERILNQRVAAALPRDRDTLEKMVIQHKEFESDLSSYESRIEEVKELYNEIPSSQRTRTVSSRHEEIIMTWERIWRLSDAYVERLKAIEVALLDLEDCDKNITALETKLSSMDTMSTDQVSVRRMVREINTLTEELKRGQSMLDALEDDVAKVRRTVEKSRPKTLMHSDVNRLEDDVKQMIRRFKNLFNDANDKLRKLEKFDDLLKAYRSKMDEAKDWVDRMERKMGEFLPVPIDQDRIRQNIADHRRLHEEIVGRRRDFEQLTDAAQNLMNQISDDEAQPIVDELSEVTDRYAKLVEHSLDFGHDAYAVAKRFWEELHSVMQALKELSDTLHAQEPPAVEPAAIGRQQEVLSEIKQDIDNTKPEVDQCRQTGKELMQLCAEPDKPEVKKNLEDIDTAWDTVTGLYAKREQNLFDAMEKAMNFHELLQSILEFLDLAEEKFTSMGPVASDIDAVKRQILELKDFKNEVEPHMVDVQTLNRQAQDLMKRTTPNQARAIREPLADINRAWDELMKGIADRQNELDNALLRLGQFQHALDELLGWMSKTERVLDSAKPVFGDSHVIEVELAKHKVLMNDIQAHQTSMDTLNQAGRQIIDANRSYDEASSTREQLKDLNARWAKIQDKAAARQRDLEEWLREAEAFNQEIADLLVWLQDVDGQLAAAKPVGGLPETAREQLDRFMELYSELESRRGKVEGVLRRGDEYVRRSPEGATGTLQHNLKTLKQRWENILQRAADRKIKLEIALREATEFQEALQEFVDWLTTAEKHLANAGQVSRIMETITQQLEEHKVFSRHVSSKRDVMTDLDKKGSHLKYFSQKQDVILIKNLLVSVQHRWEKVVAKTSERGRALEQGLKEAKEFFDAWTSLMSWLTEAGEQLETIQSLGNDSSRIKQYLVKHKEFQRQLGAKQATYDATMRLGRVLKDKAPKHEVHVLQDMLEELKNKWASVCQKSVDRQRKLEEALLFSGQFKDAIQALIDWLDKAKAGLGLDNLHGDLDTVTSLVEQHNGFQEDLRGRSKNLASVRRTANELLSTASDADATLIREQMDSLERKWEEISRLSAAKEQKLADALRQAEELHKSVHSLLEWLSDAEMKLRFAGPLPDDDDGVRAQIAEHEAFMREMAIQEKKKDATINLAEEILSKCHPDAVATIRHWITIIQSRWDEVSSWARQRESKLQEHLRGLRGIMDLLEELLAWLLKAEQDLLEAEAEPLPDDIPTIERLIEEHQRFIDEMTKRQPDVDRIAKAFSTKRQPVAGQAAKGSGRSSRTSTGYGSRTGTPTSARTQDNDIKNPKARQLMEKWRSVWILAMERMRRLQDKLDFLQEVERVKNFDFNEWRRRFLAWNANKKARIMDFFRKMDTDNDGKVLIEEFIEGFLKSKFPTSRLEMMKVAPIFDRNSDGYIDHKEYWDTLRPDRDAPATEEELIQDEVQRQVAKCTCINKYKVYHVGEGKYRFGESQKLRLVRILRSTVMVRVGGGWVSLDEFLIKNDPCRAKGRTNVELREQFVLAEGVSQAMTPFRSKMQLHKQIDNAKPGDRVMGPITKIREKTERSVPMGRIHRFGDSTSDYSFTDDNNSGTKSRPRSRLTAGSTGSRPSSRPGSRAASDLSAESLDGYQQRKIGTRYTTTSSGMQRTHSFGQTANGGIKQRWK